MMYGDGSQGMRFKLDQIRIPLCLKVVPLTVRALVLSLALALIAAISISCGGNETSDLDHTNVNAEVNATGKSDNATEGPASERGSKSPVGVDYFAHIRPEHREVLHSWLKSKPHLRPAVEEVDNWMFHEKGYEDKESFKQHFEDNVKFLRETVGKDGYQYYSVGDMNQDGIADFAVLLVDSSSKDTDEFDDFALAIFNGPFRARHSPAYFEKDLGGVTNSYIVYDRMVKNHLYLGKFESDAYCATYYPRGETYYFKDCFDE